MAAPRYIGLDGRGFVWLAHPDEWMARASAALVTPGGVIVVDPVDAPGLDERLAGLGPVAGVVQLLDRHGRDCDGVARRLGVPLLVPVTLAGRGAPLDLPGVREITVLDMPGWHESALWLERDRVLVCAEAVGTVDYFRARQSDVLGVHPLLRPRPPRRALAGVDPVTIVCGHGPPVVGGGGEALRTALARARRDMPRAWAHAVLGGIRRRRG